MFGCLDCQTRFQTVAVVTLVHYFLTVDVYLLDCFADSLTVVVAVAVACSWHYSVVDVTSGVSVCHQHCSVAQASEHVAHSLCLTEPLQAAAAVQASLAVESLVFVADEQ